MKLHCNFCRFPLVESDYKEGYCPKCEEDLGNYTPSTRDTTMSLTPLQEQRRCLGTLELQPGSALIIKRALEVYEAEVKEKDQKIEKLEWTNAELHSKLDDASTLNSRLTSRVEDLETSLHVDSGTITRLKDQLKRKETGIGVLIGENKDLYDKLRGRDATISKLKAQVVEYEQRITTLIAANNTIREEGRYSSKDRDAIIKLGEVFKSWERGDDI